MIILQSFYYRTFLFFIIIKKKKTLVASLLVVGWLTSLATFAYQENPWVTNPNPTDPVRHEAMQKALDSKDYATWKQLMTGKWVLNKIDTEAKFKLFVAMKDAYEKWDITTYNKLKTELWLGQKNWTWIKNGLGKGQGKSSTRGNK
jgi:hypothetical protein